MATADVIEDDNVANHVLMQMHKELIEQINVEEITLHLASTGMITDAHRDVLQNERRSVMERVKYLLGRDVLGKKGYIGLKALLDSLRGNTNYKPHLELASKIEASYLSRMNSVNTKPVSIVQPADPRTGETQCSSPTSLVQQDSISLQFTTPGKYQVKLGHVTSNVPVTANVQPSSSSPDMDEGDDFNSCHSSLNSLNDDVTTANNHSLDLLQGLGGSTEVVLEKHNHLKDAQNMKIIIVGNSYVGKTAIIQRYVYGRYEKAFPTRGTGYLNQYVYHSQKNTNIKLFLWDTLGQEQHNSITSIFYKNSDAAVIVFDVASQKSLDHVHWWLEELNKRVYPKRDIPIILAGNKCDLITSSSTKKLSNLSRARAKAFDLGLQDFILVSAKTGYGMEELFGRIITLALDASSKDQSKSGRGFSLKEEDKHTDTSSKCPC